MMMRRILLSTTAFGVSCGLLALPALAQQNGSQNGSYVELDTITVTAARAERSLSDIPQSVQLIDKKEIETQVQQAGSASAALAKIVPGFSMSNQTVSGASETYRGRDLLVLVDGVPLNTPLRDVSRILSLIDLNSVERIEMVSGASSLYGAGATGGTVNFITKRAEAGPPKITINSALRGFTAHPAESISPEVSATISGKAENGFDYVFVGSGRVARRTFDGAGRELPSDSMLGQGGGDRFNSGNLFAKIGRDFDGGKRFEMSANWLTFNQSPQYMTSYAGPYARPDYTQPYTGLSVLENTKSFTARYSDKEFILGSLNAVAFYNDIEKRFNYSTFSYPYNSQVYYSFDPRNPTSPYNQTTLYSKRGGVNLTIDTPLDPVWQGAKFTWGGDVIHERTHQTLTNGQDVFTPLSQTTKAIFGLVQVPLTERLTVRGGVRYEHFALDVDGFTRPAAYAAVAARTALGYQPFVLPALNVIGGKFNYSSPTFNIGATFKLTETSEIFGGFSQGFALPDVGAYTRRAGLSTAYACPVTAPNCLPASRSTISYAMIGPSAQIVDNYELGVRGSIGRFKGSLTGFISTSDKGVTFDPLTNVISQQKEFIYGAEFTGEYALTDQFTFGGMLGYREGRYDSNKDGKLDSWLPNNRIATPLRGMAFGSYRFDNGITTRVEVEAYSGRNQAIDLAGTRYKIPSGATVNVAFTAPLLGGEAYLSANNLFNANLQNPTATSVRNLPVYSWGRTVTLGYRKTF
ncbi:MAG TPA: TonB-dependent receptor [Beijerinckiaceae bacterium]|nr:TonB-dependent receptor [Beijerinckiaceae bacterium]